MPIPIIIAILIALFTLGAKINQQKKGSPAQVVIVGGKQYQVNKKDNRNTLMLITPEQHDNTVTIKEQQEAEAFENIFQLSGLYQIIKNEP